MGVSTERADSLSSGGEDDDEEDQFDLFTAGDLFGSLMDRVKNLHRRMGTEESPAKRSLFADPLRLGEPMTPRLPGLWGMHGNVRSLFDKPMTFPGGSLFDQPPFARHSSLGSQPAAESSDSREDDSSATEARTKPTRLKKATSGPQKKPGEYFWRPTFDSQL